MRPFRAPREARKRSEETWVVIKETQEPEVEALQDKVVYERLDSITETGDANEAGVDREELAMGNALGDEGADCVQESLTKSASSASPSLSEFETYLGGIEALRAQVQKDRPTNASTDEWWNSVVDEEKRRCADDQHSRHVAVDDILLGVDSSDDDVPIVSTLPTAKAKRQV